MSIKNVNKENGNLLGKKVLVIGLYDSVNFNPIDVKPDGSYIIDIRRNTTNGIFGTVVHHEFDRLYDVLEDLASLIKAMAFPKRTIYVLNGKSKDVIISLIEDLKAKCPLAFSDDLAKKYSQVLNLLKNANTLFASNEVMTSKEAIRRVDIIFNAVDIENTAKPDEEEAEVKSDIKLPKDMDPKSTFRAGMILANTITITDVVEGNYCGRMKMPLHQFLRGVIKDNHSGRPLVVCNDDASRIYDHFLRHGQRDAHNKLLYVKEFSDFLANVIPIDDMLLFNDTRGDDGWDDEILAEKWSGIKRPEKKKNAIIITANNNLSSHLNVLNTNKAIELFGIDTDKIAIRTLMSLLPNVSSKIEEMQGLYNIAKYIDDNDIDIIYIDTITINPDNMEFWDRIVELGKILKLCIKQHIKYIGADRKEYIFPAK